MSIFDYNPWWETGKIEKEISEKEKRELFHELANNLEKEFIDIITGLRRTGKTTLMYQLIDTLLQKGVNPKEIFYFSFDLEKEDIRKILSEYEEKVLRDRIKNRRVYLFLDEIHKLNDWTNQVKTIYDLNPRAKLVLSGSASLNLMKESRESLAGRAKFYYMSPLSFKEFLTLKKERIPSKEEFPVHENRIRILLNEFLLRGFPQTIEMNDKDAKNYVKELIVDRIIYRDIPETFRIEDTEILRLLTEYICQNPGAIINIDSLSRDFGRNKKTVRNALIYLELSFLIKSLKNVRGSFLAASRKNKKAYPIHTSMVSTQEEDKIIETLVGNEINAQFYWRKNSKEVDFVLKNQKILPIEVKNTDAIEKKDLKGLIGFCEMHNIKEGVVVSRTVEKAHLVDNLKVNILPLPKFILFGFQKSK